VRDLPEHADVAREVLTDVQWLTWFMAERGLSHRAIAYHRGVSKATVTDCLEACDRKMREALDAEAA
jgi:uncharacterized protein YpbB